MLEHFHNKEYEDGNYCDCQKGHNDTANNHNNAINLNNDNNYKILMLLSDISNDNTAPVGPARRLHLALMFF